MNNAQQITLVPPPLMEAMDARGGAAMMFFERNGTHWFASLILGRNEGQAPHWISRERRKDKLGRLWETENIRYVPDDFGFLVQVPQLLMLH